MFSPLYCKGKSGAIWRMPGERRKVGNMASIVRVHAMDEAMLDIQMDNGHIILLDLKPLADSACLPGLMENDAYIYPKTDGQRIFWPGGAEISLRQIMELLME